MLTAGDLFINAIEHWKDNKGIGTALIPYPLEDKLMVLGVLQRVYTRSPTCKTIIIVDNFNDRTDIIEYLTQQPDSEENNEEFKSLIKEGHLKVFTYDYLRRNTSTNFPFLCVVYRPSCIDICMTSYISCSKFKLVVLNKLLPTSEDMTTLYKYAPLLSDFKQHELDEVRTSSPVEEIQVPVTIDSDSETAKLLDYYNEYVSTSLSIFGSFDVMNQANVGNYQFNISSTQICYQIAKENGWDENLDMSVEFNIEIDKLYNPNNLKERASKTYEVIRNRIQLLADYEGKLEAIYNIVQDNLDKKILIINKRGDFASKVTDYINNLSDKIICMNYHDRVDNIPAIDINGNPIVYKSGPNKGKRKTMGSKAQKTYAETNFNKGNINVLSSNNAVDKALSIDVDIIIITSPMCEKIRNYLYRLSQLRIRGNKLLLYNIYCKETQEQKLLEAQDRDSAHIVKNSSDDNIYSDFMIGD